MSATTTVAGAGGAIAGGWLGRVIGGLAGSLAGPGGTAVGAWIGGQVGAMAGRAAASAIASYMEDANVDADAKTKESEQAKPCVDCGEIDCFSPPEGATPKQVEEFRRQLKEQQDEINRMEPDDLVRNIDKYRQQGRPTDDAANRRQSREDYRTDRTRELEEKYLSKGRNDYKEQAANDVAEEMKKLAATHTLDLVAGGDGSISGLGDKSINSSLGSQWKGRRSEQLRSHAKKAAEQKKKMNAKLEECKPEGGNDNSPDAETPDNGTGKGDGNPDVPVS
ncbi:polymorphic toxin type 15 domain-containing protein [Agrobacterium fabrum]|uniref:Novel toxin 15 domain-containing protein n=2 Tax=Agrobacterium fabrum TaxID=1176649 RepID=A9CGH1_AGRFC|nr:polymorphic toxin type 15 domain-containing protein [Agrobacterium fabrum]CAD0213852.1 hypothetical protein AGTUEHA105_LOCUS4107 [Agrobacterium tumefaciens]AAK89090.1 hypothetical protein Atu4350 [Agrobacterium fabrum str. C58]AYM60089.1 hypothetical protein At1D132_40820 [Agrobacterium fabrum]MCR6726634.1 polymorphic toxin type 15 domain-containing protein [Agrobacterium fabrum]MCX2876774.1 polymorphic toxin type 15 domain-containing protein [Agrobacterium fabrum]